MRKVFQAAAALAFGLALAAAAPAPPPEPDGFWSGPMHGAAPATITGGSVIDAKALAALIDTSRPVLIDVAAEEQKPAGMPADALWRPIHRSVPGSVWFPGAGEGSLTPQLEALLLSRIDLLTGGVKTRPVVSFCHRDCWASWNAAKRLVRAGYTRVYWFPDGAEGWQDAGYQPGVVNQDSLWAAMRRPAD